MEILGNLFDLAMPITCILLIWNMFRMRAEHSFLKNDIKHFDELLLSHIGKVEGEFLNVAMQREVTDQQLIGMTTLVQVDLKELKDLIVKMRVHQGWDQKKVEILSKTNLPLSVVIPNSELSEQLAKARKRSENCKKSWIKRKQNAGLPLKLTKDAQIKREKREAYLAEKEKELKE